MKRSELIETICFFSKDVSKEEEKEFFDFVETATKFILMLHNTKETIDIAQLIKSLENQSINNALNTLKALIVYGYRKKEFEKQKKITRQNLLIQKEYSRVGEYETIK